MKSALLGIFVVFSFNLFGQESIGIGISNYAPTNSLLLNPSSIVDSKAFIDIHLVGVSVFARNDYAYFPGSVSLLNPSSFDGVNPSYNSENAPYSAYVDVMAQGPSASMQFGKHAFALHTAVRSAVDARNIGNKFATYLTESFQYLPYQGTETRLKDVRVTGLSWAEIGLAYGTILKQEGRDMITGGVHVKKLIGIAGAGLRLNDWYFTVPDSSKLITQRISGRYGVSEAGWNTGGGWAFDVGFTYKKSKKDISGYTPHSRQSGCKKCDYQYKVSVALLDIGSVRFKGDFYANQFDENTASFTWNGYADANPEDIEEIAAIVSDHLPVLEENKASSMRVWLPAALSTQIDYQVVKNVYMNGSLVVGAPFKRALGVQRASSLAITPRYEIKRFEAALPIGFFELKDPMIGAMVRLNSVVIGTDNLGALFFSSPKYGADIYVHVKYTIFRSRQCKGVKVRESGRGPNQTPGCPTW
ncbi:MAG: hypothetical protein GC193_13015 [Cryomorphaceae bacterium]|nr:hypothetical protein [Cryomorphaceae bacterium]